MEARARFRRLFEEQYDAVLAYASRRTEPGHAEDAAAETFLTAWRRFDDLPDDPLPWLYGTARRVLSNQRRSAGRRDAVVERIRLHDAPAAPDHADEVADRSELLEAFRRLSERDREVLALVAWEDLSAERAASALGCSVSTFWVRLHRARRRLAKELGLERTGVHIDLKALL